MSRHETRCPRCGHAHFLGEEVCQVCGIEFLSWLERRAKAPKPAKAPARPKPPTATTTTRRKRRSFAFALGWAGVLAGAGLGLWLLTLPPPGLGLPPGAQCDPERGVAFLPPAGWERFPGAAARGGLEPVAAYRRGSATIELLSGPPRLTRLAAEPLGAGRLLREAFNGMDPEPPSVTEMDVDRLAALRIVAEGGRAVLAGDRPFDPLRPPPQARVRALLVVVPAAGRSLLVGLVAAGREFQREEAAAEGFLASLRVLRRPVSWWPLVLAAALPAAFLAGWLLRGR